MEVLTTHIWIDYFVKANPPVVPSGMSLSILNQADPPDYTIQGFTKYVNSNKKHRPLPGIFLAGHKSPKSAQQQCFKHSANFRHP